MVRDWQLNAFRPTLDAAGNPIKCIDDSKTLPPPQLIPVRYIQENRSEPRFLGQMQVTLQIDGEVLAGITHDLSAHGLSILVKAPSSKLADVTEVAVTFPVLEARSSGLARLQGIYREVPATVVGILAENAEEQRLRLRISETTKGHRFVAAFSAYLAQRQARLQLDTSHTLRAVTSRLYSSIFVESAATLPVFIYRSTSQEWSFRLGLVSNPSPLTDFFEIADGEFDFSVLGQEGRLEQLMQRVTEQGSGALTLYLCKQRHKDAPVFEIRSLADNEITDRVQRHAFVRHALEHDFRCVKLVASVPEVPPQAEIEQAIDRLVQLSPGKSERLKDDFTHLLAIGDLVDVTGLVEDIWSDVDPEPDPA
jgi:hypothetical protein